MTDFSRAYAAAFAEHLAESQEPVWAVESSHAWKPTVYLPAFQFCWPRMNAIARFISVVNDRFAPWSGRSDAMMNCGDPPAPYWSFPQEEAGRTYVPDCFLAPPRAAVTITSVAPHA